MTLDKDETERLKRLIKLASGGCHDQVGDLLRYLEDMVFEKTGMLISHD